LATLGPARVSHLNLPIKASERIRTPDPLITNQLLYQLSYAGTTNLQKVCFNSNRKTGIGEKMKRKEHPDLFF
jgi:hypothetical protein